MPSDTDAATRPPTQRRVSVPAAVLERAVWGDRVRLERELRGWTQAHLAAAAGVRQSDVSRLEIGRRRAADDPKRFRVVIDRDRLEAIAAAFGLPVEVVFPLRRSTDPGTPGECDDPPAP